MGKGTGTVNSPKNKAIIPILLPFCIRQEVKEWTELMGGICPADQRAQLTSLGVATARGIVASHQAAHLLLSQNNTHLQVNCICIMQGSGSAIIFLRS